jgi:hypothetical protein
MESTIQTRSIVTPSRDGMLRLYYYFLYQLKIVFCLITALVSRVDVHCFTQPDENYVTIDIVTKQFIIIFVLSYD